MFIHLFKYRLKVLLKTRSLLFWTFAFPIILGLFFNAAFSGLDNTDVIETTDVALINQSEERTDTFREVLSELKSDEAALFKVKEMSEDKAAKLLKEDKISGMYIVKDDNITLKIAHERITQTILKTFLDQYLQNEQLLQDIASTGRQITQADIEALSIQTNYIQENKSSRRGSTKSFFFFTLVGMACMYGFQWGMNNTRNQQASSSANGIRLSMVPKNKLIVILANTAAAFAAFSVVILIILLFFNKVYQVDFGERWLYIILTCLLGSLNAISFGSFLGNVIKGSYAQQQNIALAFTMIMSALAGMMGTPSLKYYISVHLPILGILNPVNLISESLYQLYYYSSMNTYFTNLLYLGVMTIFFTLMCFLLERRAQYDHI